MTSFVDNFNDILKEAWLRYEDRSAEEYRAYMDGVTDMLNLVLDEHRRVKEATRVSNMSDNEI